MDFLFSVPYLFRIVISLLSILVFQKLTKSLGWAMIMGIVVLALWIGHTPGSMARVTAERVLSLDTLFLVMVIAGVIWLSSLMSESGMMKDLVVSLRSRLSKRSILAALPAVVGLLPMPAGALFSAPLVDDADDAKVIAGDQKARINYWFRHVWEFWWPLYPGVLLATDLSGLPIWWLVALMMPLFFAAYGAGSLFLLRNVPGGKPEPKGADDKSFLYLILPTITVIVVYGLLLVLAPALSRFNKYLPMAVGVACGLIVMQLERPLTRDAWRKILFSRKVAGLVLIIVLARIYGAFVESQLPNGIMLMEAVRAELDTFGIPPVVLVVVIPFISGLTTGITVGYIGASFPVILSLAGASTGELHSTIVLGYASGYIGMMLSPIHVCLIVTNEYFKTTMLGSLKGLLCPASMVFVCAAAYSFLWSMYSA